MNTATLARDMVERAIRVRFSGDTDAANAAYDEVIATFKNSTDFATRRCVFRAKFLKMSILLERSTLDIEIADCDKAIAACDEIIATFKKEAGKAMPSVLQCKATALRAKGDIDAAIAIYDELIPILADSDPEFLMSVLWSKATALRDKGNIDAAIAIDDVRIAIFANYIPGARINPKLVEAILLSPTLSQNNDRDETATACTALRVSPKGSKGRKTQVADISDVSTPKGTPVRFGKGAATPRRRAAKQPLVHA